MTTVLKDHKIAALNQKEYGMLRSLSLFRNLGKNNRHYATSTCPEIKHTLSSHQPNLYFSDQMQFRNSAHYTQLSRVLNTFQLHRSSQPINTISMQEVLQLLSLDKKYGKFLENKWLIGIHGTSEQSLSALCPHPHNIKNMQTSHNPYHTNDAPLYCFYGDNIPMAEHYASLNSANEEINGNSNPHYHLPKILILGFTTETVIEKIQNDSIPIAQTMAWLQKNNQLPDEHPIGNEIRLPASEHSSITNLPVAVIRGEKRKLPLDQGIQYYQGRQCIWEPIKGYVDPKTGNQLQEDSHLTLRH